MSERQDNGACYTGYPRGSRQKGACCRRSLRARPQPTNLVMTFDASSHSNDLAHNMVAVRGEWAHLARPAAFFHCFCPFLAEQHIGAVDLVDGYVSGLAFAIQHLALTTNIEGGRFGLHTAHCTYTWHLQEQRNVLSVVD